MKKNRKTRGCNKLDILVLLNQDYLILFNPVNASLAIIQGTDLGVGLVTDLEAYVTGLRVRPLTDASLFCCSSLVDPGAAFNVGSTTNSLPGKNHCWKKLALDFVTSTREDLTASLRP